MGHRCGITGLIYSAKTKEQDEEMHEKTECSRKKEACRRKDALHFVISSFLGLISTV